VWRYGGDADFDEGVLMARRRRSVPRRSPKRRVSKKFYKAICAHCGKEMTMEVAPPPGKALLCLECFNKEEIKEGLLSSGKK